MKVEYKKVILWTVVAAAAGIGIWQAAKAIKARRDRKAAAEQAALDAQEAAANQNAGTQITNTGTSAQVVETVAPLDGAKILRYGAKPSAELKAAKEVFNKAILSARNKKIKADPKISTKESYWQDKAERLSKIAKLETLDVASEYGAATKKVVLAIFGYTDFNLNQARQFGKNWDAFLKSHTI